MSRRLRGSRVSDPGATRFGDAYYQIRILSGGPRRGGSCRTEHTVRRKAIRLGRIDRLAPITFGREQQTPGVLVRHILLADSFDRQLLHDLSIAHHRDPLA